MFSLDNVLNDLASFFVSMAGNGFDPSASPLPAFRQRKPPSVELPKKPQKKAPDLEDSGIYSDVEIDEMTQVEFATKVGGAKTKAQFFSQKAEPKPKTVIDFDEEEKEMHGITAREYGEMKAYTPMLNDLQLASKVKRGKAAGKSLKKIADEIRETYQTVRHYSAALGRAQND